MNLNQVLEQKLFSGFGLDVYSLQLMTIDGNMKIVWVSKPETQTRNPGLQFGGFLQSLVEIMPYQEDQKFLTHPAAGSWFVSLVNFISLTMS